MMAMCDHWEGCYTLDEKEKRIQCYVCGGCFCPEHAPVREGVLCVCGLERTGKITCRRNRQHRVCDQCWSERDDN